MPIKIITLLQPVCNGNCSILERDEATRNISHQYAHGFVVAFVGFMWSVRDDSYELYSHIFQGYFTGAGATVSLYDVQRKLS